MNAVVEILTQAKQNKDEAATQTVALRDAISKLTKEITKNTERIQSVTDDINSLKLKKDEIRFELKQLYTGMLKDEEKLL